MRTTPRGPESRRFEHLTREAKRGQNRRRASLGPIVEGLEDRCLLSGQITVTTTIDSLEGNTSSISALIANPGPDGITLRSAIVAANNTPATKTSPNVITVGSGTYTLTKGELDVTNDLTINGTGSTSPIIEAGTSLANSDGKIFSFNPYNDSTGSPTEAAGFAVSLSDLTLQFGKNPFQFNSSGQSEGGAFDFDAGTDGGGSLSLSSVVITNNQTTAGDGGGIALFDGGTISITNSMISSNTATGTSSGGGGSGGGIYIGDSYSLPATVTITGTTITGNKTAGTAAGPGGGLFSALGTEGSGDGTNSIALHGDTITSNTSATGQDGGGVDVYGGLTVDQGTLISGNSAGRWGGGLFLSGTANITSTNITSNSASGGVGGTNINEGGGGIFANDSLSNVTVTDSRIVANTATVGGSQLDGDGASSFGGILNAANNWFGTNTLSSSFFGGGVKTLTTSPFLKETIASSATSLAASGTATLTVAITTNSGSQTGFSVPNGTPATFSGGTIGSVNPFSTSTTSGVATTTFTALSTPGQGNVSATIDNQTLNLQLTIVGIPTANSQSVNVPHDSAGTAITLTGSDPNSPPLSLTYAIATEPSHGTITSFNTSTGAATYKPVAGYHGSDSFSFTVTNSASITSPAATVTLSVAVGTPTANPQTVGVAHDSAGTGITLTSTDDDFPPLTPIFAFTQPSHGTVVFSGATGSPTVVYTPNAGYHGSDSFTFTVSNGTNTSAPATVTLNVAVGTPTANAQSVSTIENTALNITLTGSDDDMPPLTLAYTFTQPSHGTVTVSGATGSPTVVYTPNNGFTGPDSFTFTISNGTNISAPATVSIAVASNVATVGGTVGITWGTAGTATLLTNADGLHLLPTGRNTDLPWLGIDTLSITLSQAETLSASDVSVTGITIANYGPVTISGSGTNYTITLAQPISAADRVTVTIGNANIATYTRRLDVLPGDFNDDGVVNAQDAVLVRNEYLGLAMPTIFGDINGDGTVDLNDYTAIRRLLGTALPPLA